jgi:predicted nucleic acid-binding protein
MFTGKASMKSVLLHTNVILDFLLKREPNDREAQTVIKEIVDGRVQGYITASMVTDIFYLLQKINGKATALASFVDLLIIIDVLTVTRDDIYAVLSSGWDDLEDALQAHVAIRGGIDAIVTRNIKDYQNAQNIDIVLPHDFIQYLEE